MPHKYREKTIIPTTMGGYPRPPWFAEYLKKLEGSQKENLKEISEEIEQRAINDILDEQKKAGIELFTDGQLIWQDFLCHQVTKIEGFKMTGLTRYFDNNAYYRVPVAESKLKLKDNIISDEFELAYKTQPQTKAVLSCYSLGELSKNEFYNNKEEFVMDIANIINKEAKNLVKKGAKYIQLDEPSLLWADKNDLEIAKEAINKIRNGVDAKFFLATYYKDASNIFPEILDFNVDVIGLDFVEGYEKHLELLKEYKTKKEIQAGIVDGRTTKMEKREEIKNKINNIIDCCDADTFFLSPNTGLELLPYVKASEKLMNMCNCLGGEKYD